LSLWIKFRNWRRYFYRVPWCVPAWGRREFAIAARCALSGKLVRGPYGERLSAELRQALGVPFVLPVNRGRTAIELALRAAGIRTPDEVVLPSYLCESVLEAVLRAGAQPVFADVGPDLNLTPDTLTAAVTPRTRAVIVPHLFGNPAPIDGIEDRLKHTDILLIDDAAQAFGARRAGRLLGTFGDCGIISCGPGKPLTGAAGGALVTSNEQLFQRASALALGREPSGSGILARIVGHWIERRFRRYTLPFLMLVPARFREREVPHHSATISNVDAGIMLSQLRSAPDRLAQRRCNLRSLLAEVAGFGGSPVCDLSENGAAAKLAVILPPDGPLVEQAIESLRLRGIESQPGYQPLHRKAATALSLPVTDSTWERVLCIPVETRVKLAPCDLVALAGAPAGPRRSGTVGQGTGAAALGRSAQKH